MKPRPSLHWTWLVVFTLLSACQTAPPVSDITLPILFSDHMVLQRDAAAPVWGKGSPGGKVSVIFQEMRAETVVADDSSWKIMLAPHPAGGPYTLQIAGSDTITINDVLVGDVWLGSGQSNMQWSVQQSADAEAEIAAANYPNIRLFSVDRTVAARPRTKIPSDGWHHTTPETIVGFSAVAYYFGRSLHDSLDVPIGLIHSSWGGTRAEAWTSAQTLTDTPYFQEAVANLAATVDEFDRGPDTYQAIFDEWLEKIGEKDRGYVDGKPVWAEPDFDTADWSTMETPALWEDEYLPNYDGVVWFRKTFDAPSSWVNQELSLHLGMIDDADVTWVNGVEVGRTSQYNRKREYTVPSSAVRAGKNVIAVRVLDTGGGGGIWGEVEDMRVERSDRVGLAAALAGTWNYNTALSLGDVDQLPPRPEALQHTPTVLFNAMINPLVPYGIRGVIWYQGESNAGRAYQYRTLFPGMITDWRKQWDDNFSFLFVQLANFRELQQNPSEEQTWPELREAQSMALDLAKTGMAVIIDIGETDDIHPRNKQDVGARLARAALNVSYEQDIVAGGPLYREMRIENNVIRINFDQVGGGLVTPDGESPAGFAIAGPDSVFHWADARIDGDDVVVSNPDVSSPIAVRYGWADNPIVNLYNADGVPASPFRTDDWPGVTGGE